MTHPYPGGCVLPRMRALAWQCSYYYWCSHCYLNYSSWILGCFFLLRIFLCLSPRPHRRRRLRRWQALRWPLAGEGRGRVRRWRAHLHCTRWDTHRDCWKWLKDLWYLSALWKVVFGVGSRCPLLRLRMLLLLLLLLPLLLQDPRRCKGHPKDCTPRGGRANQTGVKGNGVCWPEIWGVREKCKNIVGNRKIKPLCTII